MACQLAFERIICFISPYSFLGASIQPSIGFTCAECITYLPGCQETNRGQSTSHSIAQQARIRLAIDILAFFWYTDLVCVVCVISLMTRNTSSSRSPCLRGLYRSFDRDSSPAGEDPTKTCAVCAQAEQSRAVLPHSLTVYRARRGETSGTAVRLKSDLIHLGVPSKSGVICPILISRPR